MKSIEEIITTLEILKEIELLKNKVAERLPFDASANFCYVIKTSQELTKEIELLKNKVNEDKQIKLLNEVLKGVS